MSPGRIVVSHTVKSRATLLPISAEFGLYANVRCPMYIGIEPKSHSSCSGSLLQRMAWNPGRGLGDAD